MPLMNCIDKVLFSLWGGIFFLTCLKSVGWQSGKTLGRLDRQPLSRQWTKNN